MKPLELAGVCKDFARATNLPQGSMKFYSQVEKHIRTEMAQGRLTDYDEICQFSETIFSANVCSNEFQRQLELRLVAGLDDANLQQVTLLLKGLSDYYLKETALEELLCQFVIKNQSEFTTKQLETLLWALSKRL
jgi:hypothetical protein